MKVKQSSMDKIKAYRQRVTGRDEDNKEQETNIQDTTKREDPSSSHSDGLKVKKSSMDAIQRYRERVSRSGSATGNAATRTTNSHAQTGSARDSGVRRSYAARDHEQEELVAGLNSGSVRYETGKRELEELSAAYDANPNEETAAAYNQRLEAFQRDLDDYNSYVERYNHYNSSEGVKERHAAAREKMKAAEEDIRYAQAMVDLREDEGYISQEEVDRAKGELERARKAYNQAAKVYDELGQMYYYVENQEKQASLQNNIVMSSHYSTGKELQEDLDKLSTAVLYASEGVHDLQEYDDYEQIKAYLHQKYGLEPKAIEEYVANGSGAVTSDGSISVYDLYTKLEEQKNTSTQALTGAGYDYQRMVGYEQMLADKAEYERKQAEWQEYAKKHKVLSSIETIIAAPLQGVDYLKTMIGGIGHSDLGDLDNYVPMNVYAMDATNFVSTVRDTVSKEIEANTNWELMGQNVWSFLYQTGMSIGDSAVQVATFGSFAPAVMGAGAASNQAKNILERGGSNRQALVGGLAAGAAEMLFEKFSVERLMSIKNVHGWRAVLEKTAKQMGAEASEEAFTEIANILADVAIMGDKSEYAAAVQEYMRTMSEEEAKERAFLDCVGQVALAGVGGALSGFAMGGSVSTASAVVNHFDEKKVGTKMQKYGDEALQGLIESGLESTPGTESRRMAEKLAAKQASGKTITAAEIGALQMANERAIQQEQETDPILELAREKVAEENAQKAAEAPDLKSEGRTVDLAETEDVGENPSFHSLVKEASESFGTTGQKAFQTLAGMKTNTLQPGELYAGFAAYYNAGRTGQGMESVSTPYTKKLNQLQAESAYDAGVKDAEIGTQNKQLDLGVISEQKNEPGLISNSFSGKMDTNISQTVDSAAKSVGRKVVFEDLGSNEKAFLDESGVLHMDIRTKDPVKVVLSYGFTDVDEMKTPAEQVVDRDITQSAVENVDKLVYNYTNEPSGGLTQNDHEKAATEITEDSYDNQGPQDSSFGVHADKGADNFTLRDQQEANTNGRREEISDTSNVGSTGSVGEDARGREERNRERLQGRIKEILRRTAQQRNEKSVAGRGHGRVERKESRTDFETRVLGDGYRYAETNVGETALAFKFASKNTMNDNAKTAVEKLEQLGFDVIVFDGELLINRKGVTEAPTEGTTIYSNGKLTIFISSDLSCDGMETAFHEALHAARRGLLSKYRAKIDNIIENNVDTESEAFETFISTIADLYAYSEREVSQSTFDAEIIEEFYAWYVGKLHAENGGDLLKLIRQFSDIESAKVQIDAIYAKMRGNKRHAIPGLWSDLDAESNAEIEATEVSGTDQKTDLVIQEEPRGANFVAAEKDGDGATTSRTRPKGGINTVDEGQGNSSEENAVDHDAVDGRTEVEERWTASRVGTDEKKPKRLTDIIEQIRHDFGINITTGHIRGKGVRGTYNLRNSGIRTKIANNLPTVAHELGHHLDTIYALTSSKNLPVAAKEELENSVTDEQKALYKKEKWIKEAAAEFLRKYLQNRETAAIGYPEFTKYFLNSLSGKDAALLQQLADEVNAYYSLDADTTTSAIRLWEEGEPDARTAGEKIKAKASALYQAWVDSLHGIKVFDKATGASTYKLAANAAYSDAIAGQLIIGDLTDANGQYIAPGLKAALHGLDMNNKTEYRAFGEYLVVKHGPERLAEGLRVFADDRKNSSIFMQRRQMELEQQYPHFEGISDRLYEFQKDFLKTWGVETGLVGEEIAKEWAERWSYYVPLNRVVNSDKRSIGAKRGFANQNSTIKKARGSGLDVVHPVDSIINNIVKMVNAGVRNNVMRKITDAAATMGANASFLEKVPTPMVRRGFDMSGVKAQLIDWLEDSGVSTSDKERVAGVVNNLDDILYQYGKGKAHGDVVTVLREGRQEFWKINDPQLLSSITTMAPKPMEGILDAYAVVSRFMTGNITGNNVVWSLFSNFPRDIMTMLTYSKNKNPVKMFSAMGSAYVNKVKDGIGKGVNPLYQEYLAMGGGKTSAYTADRDLAKRARKKLQGKNIRANPIEWISWASDTIELGPRFATYKVLRENGMDPQDAFYEAMDITVNFRRGGRVSQGINKVVPFFNASVQSLDKFRRWITAEEIGQGRKKAVFARTTTYIAVSAAIAAVVYALNYRDEEDEENYEQLSNFTKNSYWCIPIGDGKYFAIPKPRELAVLSSFFETCMEYGIGKNDRAFDEFYDYAVDNFMPSVASDIAKGDWAGIVGSLGIAGVGAYMMANRDFLGRPIVSSGLQNLEPKDQYTDRTSKIAYWIGRTFETSPQMVDYFFSSILGGWWKYQKALFPVGGENVDFTLGVQNSYIKDNQYSTDIVNWLYDKKDASEKAKNSDKANMKKAITAKMDRNMTSFYSTYYALAKNTAETPANRAVRQTVLSMILEYQKAADAGTVTKTQAAVYDFCETKRNTDYLPSTMPSTIKDGKNRDHTLSAVQYVEYQTDYLRLYWESVEENMCSSMTMAEKEAVLKAAKTVAKEEATARTLARIGASASDYTEKYSGVSTDDVLDFIAKVTMADADGSVKQTEVIDIITGMDLSDDNAWTLYFSKYDGKAAQGARENGIPAELFMTAKIDMDNITPDYDKSGKEIKGSRRKKIERYLISTVDNNREYLYLLGMEFPSVKKDADYIAFFGDSE